ncbi:exonuclease SbcCD subunit D C-terminal domain-containing protein [Spirosoma montaniterrae]|uniref:Nuclease SbcCD subunit D n=1 Tax=Spirosoma montaniterrae TaxID=1178516 RepID=A0A1P9X2J8_9BACT|nr:exonuclease SbcCD subunit D C-terminal domain-containing protein [Spirosoma montaniterrae]AQG81852.1 exonuclease sbcCD subunit D [Spirosoma montaniterrae]
MKVLHTADWHLGKRLYRHDLSDDHLQFLDWLCETIEQRQIDVVLIAGDIFDTTNPNDGSMQLYYQFLTRMLPLECKIIITGGNHDSATKLNAPRDLLRSLNIHVVGCTNGNCADEVLRLTNGSVDLLVAAVPYLRDSDLRQSISGQTYDDRVEAVRMGIRNHYERIADHCHTCFADVPVVAMGHLYVKGATVSESEREIHAVGGQAAFSSEHFPSGFDYVALGHIHVPQRVGAGELVRYSGSPIPLSFGERDNRHQVLELTFANGKLTTTEALTVPRFRSLRQVTGSLDEVYERLSQLEPGGSLTTLIEVLVEEERENLAARMQFEQLQRDFANAPFRIAKARLTFRNKRQGLESLYAIDTHLQDLSYLDVFARRLEASDVADDMREILTETYKELYQSVVG